MIKKKEEKIKKAKVKRRIVKEVEKRVKEKSPDKNTKVKLKNAKPEHYFILLDGRPLKNLLELAEAMDEMTDEIFHHHVNEFRNDFATWTKEILKEVELAEKLQKLNSKERHQIE